MKPVVPRTRPLVDAGAASATDILMNLFVFFFIAFSLLATFDQREEAAEQRAHDLELPAAGGEAPRAPAQAVAVEIARSEALRVDGRPVLATALTTAVSEAMRGERKPIVVRADKTLSLETTMKHLDRIWAAGPASVSIATIAPANPTSPAATGNRSHGGTP